MIAPNVIRRFRRLGLLTIFAIYFLILVEQTKELGLSLYKADDYPAIL